MKRKNEFVNMNICDELINQLMFFEFLINKAMGTHGTIPMGYTMTVTSGRDGVHSKNQNITQVKQSTSAHAICQT